MTDEAGGDEKKKPAADSTAAVVVASSSIARSVKKKGGGGTGRGRNLPRDLARCCCSSGPPVVPSVGGEEAENDAKVDSIVLRLRDDPELLAAEGVDRFVPTHSSSGDDDDDIGVNADLASAAPPRFSPSERQRRRNDGRVDLAAGVFSALFGQRGRPEFCRARLENDSLPKTPTLTTPGASVAPPEVELENDPEEKDAAEEAPLAAAAIFGGLGRFNCPPRPNATPSSTVGRFLGLVLPAVVAGRVGQSLNDDGTDDDRPARRVDLLAAPLLGILTGVSVTSLGCTFSSNIDDVDDVVIDVAVLCECDLRKGRRTASDGGGDNFDLNPSEEAALASRRHRGVLAGASSSSRGDGLESGVGDDRALDSNLAEEA
jgi:hypothetical protein